MMRAIRTMHGIACATPFVLAAAVAAAAAPEPAGRAVVDIFPVQQWAMLGAQAEPAAPSAAPPEMPAEIDPDAFGGPEPEAAAPPPFRLTGEWRDADGLRVVVLEGAPELRLLCERRCDVRGAVQPGGEIAPGYRLKRLAAAAALIVSDDGAEFTLPAPGLDS